MGTRGLIGFRLNNEDKFTYNHWDSYPDELGKNILKELRTIKDFKRLKETVKNIELIESNSEPTKTQITKYKKFTDTSVSSQNVKDWYYWW